MLRTTTTCIYTLEHADGTLPMAQSELQAAWQSSSCSDGVSTGMTRLELSAPPGTHGQEIMPLNPAPELRSPDRWLKRIPRLAWVATYLVLVTGGLSILFAGWAYDNPFITYRYAENLSRGLGLVYNPGESLLSTSTPLFALLLAALRPIWSDLHGLAVFIGALSLAVGGLCLWDLMDATGLRYSRWAGLLFYPLFPLVASTLSSETPLYLTLCLGTFASYRRQHYRLAALSAGLAALVRPDGILVAAILGLHYLWSQRPKPGEWCRWLTSLPWQAVLIYLGIGLSWLVFAWATYLSPIPLTLFAKQQQATVAGSQAFLPGLSTIASWYSSWLYQVEALLALPGLVHGLRRSPALRWLAAWTALYFSAYSLLGVTRYFWYYAPLVPLFVLAFGCGVDGVNNLFRRIRSGQVVTEVVTTIKTMIGWLPGLALVFLLLVQADKLWHLHLAPDTCYPIYRAAGEWLRENSPPIATIGTLEVGIIGYYAQRPMVDFAGMLQPDVAIQLGQAGSYSAAAQWAVYQYDPEYLVLQQGLFPEIEAEILPSCRLQVKFPAVAYGYAYDMSIYACP